MARNYFVKVLIQLGWVRELFSIILLKSTRVVINSLYSTDQFRKSLFSKASDFLFFQPALYIFIFKRYDHKGFIQKKIGKENIFFNFLTKMFSKPYEMPKALIKLILYELHWLQPKLVFGGDVMGRKIFISFLGAGNYSKVQYAGSKIETPYIQTAIIESKGADFFDQINILVTETSREKHWKYVNTLGNIISVMKQQHIISTSKEA